MRGDFIETPLITKNEPLSVDADYEARALDTICVNESLLQHKWYRKPVVLQIFFCLC